MNVRPANSRRPIALAALAAFAVTAASLAVVAPAQAAVADSAPSASARVSNGTLVITGTNGPDDIQMALGADPGTLLVDLGQHPTATLTFDRATFSSIFVSLGAGDDSFTVVTARGDVTTPITVQGGNGNDTITGGSGNDTLVGGNGNDNLLGGAGTDLIFGGRGVDTIDGGPGNDTEILGQGDDVAVWNPGEGSDMIDGGQGHDTLRFNGSNGNENIAVSANGSGDLLTRDVGNIRMDMANVEALQLVTLGGADTVTLHDLHRTALAQAGIDLSAAGLGDGQPDTVVVEGSDGPDHVKVNADGNAVNIGGLAVATRLTGSEGFDQLHVNTGAGNDTVQVSEAVNKLIGVTVDLGSGQH
jgi:Ca2+-binding RTX toxin-like protein